MCRHHNQTVMCMMPREVFACIWIQVPSDHTQETGEKKLNAHKHIPRMYFRLNPFFDTYRACYPSRGCLNHSECCLSCKNCTLLVVGQHQSCCNQLVIHRRMK
jgi:hypothetical protein